MKTDKELYKIWLEQRFKDKTKKEIETMFLGELPDLEETASGKDLIRIGEQRGEQRGEKRSEKRGREQTILAILNAWYGTVPARSRVANLDAGDMERLIHFLRHCQSLDEVIQWLGITNPKSLIARDRAPRHACRCLAGLRAWLTAG